jgi:hypothetical protein
MAWVVSAISPLKPGTTETPAAAARFLDSILSPMASMAPGLGPMNTTPASAHMRAKPAFSDRKPKPGWIACAPVDFAAAMMTSPLR